MSIYVCLHACTRHTHSLLCLAMYELSLLSLFILNAMAKCSNRATVDSDSQHSTNRNIPKGPSTNMMWTLGFYIERNANMVWAKYSLFEAFHPLGIPAAPRMHCPINAPEFPLPSTVPFRGDTMMGMVLRDPAIRWTISTGLCSKHYVLDMCSVLSSLMSSPTQFLRMRKLIVLGP